MTAPLLRDATPADFAAIVRLNAESVQFTSTMDDAKLRRFYAMAAYLRVAVVDGQGAAFLLAFAADAPYWSENFRWFRERYGRFLYIDRIVVDAPHRGRGLGRLLYEDLFAFARSQGCAHVTCEFDVEPPNAASAAFHARFGFREVGSRQVTYADKRVAMQEAPL